MGPTNEKHMTFHITPWQLIPRGATPRNVMSILDLKSGHVMLRRGMSQASRVVPAARKSNTYCVQFWRLAWLNTVFSVYDFCVYGVFMYVFFVLGWAKHCVWPSRVQ